MKILAAICLVICLSACSEPRRRLTPPTDNPRDIRIIGSEHQENYKGEMQYMEDLQKPQYRFVY